MNRFKRKAFEQEFPFLSAILADHGREEKLQSIRVSRIDENLLKSTPSVYRWGGSLVDINKVESVHFILSTGKILFDAVRSDREIGSNYAHTETVRVEGESVLEAIDRLEVTDLSHIVWVRSGFRVENHHSTRHWEITVFKEAKSLKIEAALEAARAEALEQVRAEADLD